MRPARADVADVKSGRQTAEAFSTNSDGRRSGAFCVVVERSIRLACRAGEQSVVPDAMEAVRQGHAAGSGA